MNEFTFQPKRNSPSVSDSSAKLQKGEGKIDSSVETVCVSQAIC